MLLLMLPISNRCILRTYMRNRCSFPLDQPIFSVLIEYSNIRYDTRQGTRAVKRWIRTAVFTVNLLRC